MPNKKEYALLGKQQNSSSSVVQRVPNNQRPVASPSTAQYFGTTSPNPAPAPQPPTPTPPVTAQGGLSNTQQLLAGPSTAQNLGTTLPNPAPVPASQPSTPTPPVTMPGGFSNNQQPIAGPSTVQNSGVTSSNPAPVPAPQPSMPIPPMPTPGGLSNSQQLVAGPSTAQNLGTTPPNSTPVPTPQPPVAVPPPAPQPTPAPSSASVAGNIVYPIDNVFRAWNTLDLQLYMDQWAPDAVQYYGKDHRRRGFNAISQKRADDFKKYSQVVGQYRVLGREPLSNNSVKVTIEYVMSFKKHNGEMLSDGTPGSPKQEIYLLTYDANKQRWLITENVDN